MPVSQTVHIIEDDPGVGDSLAVLLQSAGLCVALHKSAEDFLATTPDPGGVVVSDIRMPGMTGIELLAEFRARRLALPVILMTAFADVPQAVQAMKLGALDFIEKPFDDELMISSVKAALARLDGGGAAVAREKINRLSGREKDVLDGLLNGKLNKTIAYELGVSVRTIETHRANLMSKTGAKSLSELIRLTLIAETEDS